MKLQTIHTHLQSLSPVTRSAFSFISALALAAAPATPKKVKRRAHSSFHDYPELLSVLLNCQHICFRDSAYQLFKGICDIAHRGILISEKTSDYMSFIFYQMAGYLLLSSSFVTVLAIQQMGSSMLLPKAAVVSVCIPFATFLLAACALYLATSSAKGLQGDASQVAQRLQLLGSVNS